MKGPNFIGEELTILNSTGPDKHQAVALVFSAEVAFYNCRFSGFQDALYVHAGSQFFHNCIIEATIDFIFGKATAVFQNFLILVKQLKPGQVNVLTTNGSNGMANQRGIVIHKSLIGVVPANKIWLEDSKNSTYLGRPWSDTAAKAIINSYIGHVIHPDGWLDWNSRSKLNSIDYVKHQNIGIGSRLSKRVKWKGCRANLSEAEI
ncbi:pectinesterase 3-like [Castanea sativa]|uniref:pectinesterase 3-like n=1 Tax=Castanea sativa TaxID=21020 RepID=UPI003F64A95F